MNCVKNCTRSGGIMGDSSKFLKSLTLEIQIFKLAECLQILIISCLNGYLCLDNLKINQSRYYFNLPNSAFWDWLSMESQPQNPEFRINPENFHPWGIQKEDVILYFLLQENELWVAITQFEMLSANCLKVLLGLVARSDMDRTEIVRFLYIISSLVTLHTLLCPPPHTHTHTNTHTVIGILFSCGLIQRFIQAGFCKIQGLFKDF